MIKFLVIIPAIANGVLYRCGGSGNWPRWSRPVGIAFMAMLAMWILGLWHWSVILCAGLSAGASTTYFKKSGTNASTINWICVGLAFGLAFLPYAYLTHHWIGFVARTAICAGLTAIWSSLIGWDVMEEFGRGVIPIITLVLFLI